VVEARGQFSEELARLEHQALDGLEMVVAAVERLLEALRSDNELLAARVVADDDVIDDRYLLVHRGLLTLLARQSPKATDLRLIAALLNVIGHMERMGDQCVNVAKLIPSEPDPALLALIDEMCVRSGSLVRHAREAFSRRDLPLAEALVPEDDAVDLLNRRAFRLALEIGEDPDRRESAMYLMLAARCVERLADNAVDIGEQTAFVVTGLFREFTDASRPERPGEPR
jgi:phosphate transport system protein